MIQLFSHPAAIALEICVAQSAILSVTAKSTRQNSHLFPMGWRRRNSVCEQSVWECAKRSSPFTHDGLDRRDDPDHGDPGLRGDPDRDDRDRCLAK